MKRLPPIAGSYEQFRGILIRVLAANPIGQQGELYNTIASAAIQMGLANDPGSDHRSKGQVVNGFPSADATIDESDRV